MAAVGSIESLLTLQLLDGIIEDGKRGSTKRELIGQGIGNLASGLAGGIDGCALIGQSIINAQSGGGVSQLSGMSMALFLALGIVSFAPLLGKIPVVALAGVMLLVCQSTFSWGSLRLLGKIPTLDAFIIALVTVVTVKDDLAKAVLVGTITSALGFACK
jgi:SulP family sulfate permease